MKGFFAMNENEKLEFERLKAVENKVKQRQKQSNDIIKNNYDRIGAVFPKGTKARIQKAGYKMNDFLVKSVLDRLDQIENENGSDCPF